MKTILTYGTFDLFHIGHLNILRRLKEMGDKLLVGVSTDEFNEKKGKKSVINFNNRLEIVSCIKYVDFAFPENDWSQKLDDIKKYNVDVFAMGSDWCGKFDDFRKYCQVIYLPRTDGISSSDLKKALEPLNKEHIADLRGALDLISNIVSKLELD